MALIATEPPIEAENDKGPASNNSKSAGSNTVEGTTPDSAGGAVPNGSAAGSGPNGIVVQRGAEALAMFEGVWRVAVFGSVARRTADRASDIDYVVVCDEIDYGARNKLAKKMMAEAANATGHRVDVVLSDTAEWMARTAVASSLEAHLDSEAVDLVRLERPTPTTTKQRRTITMASKMELAVVELNRMERSLGAMVKVATRNDLETEMIEEGEEDMASWECANRWLQTLQDADMALEHGLTALGVATDSPRVGRDKFHQLAAYRDVIADEYLRDLAASILEPLSVMELPIDVPLDGNQLEFTKWRKVVDYGAEEEVDEYVSGDRVMRYMVACVEMGELALAETLTLTHPPHSKSADEKSIAIFRRRLEKTSRFVDNYDPETGTTRASA